MQVSCKKQSDTYLFARVTYVKQLPYSLWLNTFINMQITSNQCHHFNQYFPQNSSQLNTLQ